VSVTPRDSDVFEVSGRGELHLTILLENMRREGFELAVGQAARRFQGNRRREVRAVRDAHRGCGRSNQGGVMEELGRRRGELQEHGAGRQRACAPGIPHPGTWPDRLPGEFMTLTRGTGLMSSHVFDDYAPVKPDMPGRHNGVLISARMTAKPWPTPVEPGRSRPHVPVSPGDKLYEGMIIGIHSRDNDLVVNPIKGKKLTNVRASGTDEAVRLTTPIKLTLESAVEFIDDDELVEITPQSIRLRKRYLTENERKRMSKVES
jgi:GTP-binding protein